MYKKSTLTSNPLFSHQKAGVDMIMIIPFSINIASRNEK